MKIKNDVEFQNVKDLLLNRYLSSELHFISSGNGVLLEIKPLPPHGFYKHQMDFLLELGFVFRSVTLDFDDNLCISFSFYFIE